MRARCTQLRAAFERSTPEWVVETLQGLSHQKEQEVKELCRVRLTPPSVLRPNYTLYSQRPDPVLARPPTDCPRGWTTHIHVLRRFSWAGAALRIHG